MFKLPQSETKTLVAVHGWSAIALGLLLYAVVLTGTIAVFAHEIGHWSIGKAEQRSVFDRPIDQHLRKAVASVAEKYREDIDVRTSPRGNLQLWPHTHEKRDSGGFGDIGVLIEIDQVSGQEVARRAGWAEDVFPEPAAALQRFLVDTHVQLHVPNPWGLILTGILGLAMMVAAISGLLMHRHLIKDSFTLRRERRTLVSARDEHTVAGTWGLPFAFLLALTGAFFSFALSIGVPVMSMVAFKGDQQKMFDVIGGGAPAPDARPAVMADLDAIVRAARARVGEDVNRISISHYGRMDARVTLGLAAPKGTLEPVTLVYDGAGGSFEKEKPSLGTAPSFGATLFSIIAPLHFGNFGGVVSKLVWLALGFASCYLIVTGMTLWLKRRADDPRWQIFGHVNAVVLYGLPIALATSAAAFLPTYPGEAAMMAAPIGFLIGASAVIAYSVLALRKKAVAEVDATHMRILGFALLLLPFVRILTGGPFWISAIDHGANATVGVDLALVLGGWACILTARRWRLLAASAPPSPKQGGIDRLRPAE